MVRGVLVRANDDDEEDEELDERFPNGRID
jgi:hypothetical protein